MSIQLRFAQTAAAFMQTELLRLPKLGAPAAPAKRVTQVPKKKESRDNSKRHSNSKRAVLTRQAKYGDSRMKASTRDSKRANGDKVRKDRT